MTDKKLDEWQLALLEKFKKQEEAKKKRELEELQKRQLEDSPEDEFEELEQELEASEEALEKAFDEALEEFEKELAQKTGGVEDSDDVFDEDEYIALEEEHVRTDDASALRAERDERDAFDEAEEEKAKLEKRNEKRAELKARRLEEAREKELRLKQLAEKRILKSRADDKRYRRKRDLNRAPKHMSGAVLDRCEKLPRDKWFYVGDPYIRETAARATQLGAELLREYIAQPLREMPHNIHKTREFITIGGGNYTCHEILARVMPILRHELPRISVHMQQCELIQPSDIKNMNIDMMLSGYSEAGLVPAPMSGIRPEQFDELRSYGYEIFRQNDMIADPARWSCTTELLEKYGSKKETLMRAPMIGTRMYYLTGENTIIKPYTAIPEGRKSLPKIRIDSFLLSTLTMLHGSGIWYTFGSERKRGDIVTLEEKPIYTIKRFIFFKNETSIRRLLWVANRIFLTTRAELDKDKPISGRKSGKKQHRNITIETSQN